MLISPNLVGFFAVGAVGIVWLVWLSLHDINILAGKTTYVGLANYKRVFSDSGSPTVFTNTMFFVIILSVGGTICALLLALLLNRRIPGINIFRSAIFLPALVTMVAWSMVWRFILMPEGLLDGLLQAVGLSGLPWLTSRWLTLTMLAIVQLVKNVGVNVLLFLAALQATSRELDDAAKIDGSNAWQRFYYVTLPQISPAVLMVFMMMVSGSFAVFDVVFLMTGGGPGTDTAVLSFAIYNHAFAYNDLGYASTLGVFLFVLVLLVVGSVWAVRRRFVFYERND